LERRRDDVENSKNSGQDESNHRGAQGFRTSWMEMGDSDCSGFWLLSKHSFPPAGRAREAAGALVDDALLGRELAIGQLQWASAALVVGKSDEQGRC